MSKRGTELRDHILYAAKNVFLEMGFERASMDVIAARAQTSKRTLYAHFESKENLYLSIIDLIREMYSSKLRSPGDYSEDTQEALVLFCGRYLQGLLFVWTVRMCRMSIAEAERFPEGSSRYFDVIVNDPLKVLGGYLGAQFNLSEEASSKAAQDLISTIVFPRFTRALFGIGETYENVDESLNPNLDLEPVRRAVAKFIGSLKL
jgi:AcrR family transcriptional regulator